MPVENIYDLYITDQERNIILEERSSNVHTTERIISDYHWSNGPRSYAQLWKHDTRFSFSIHYLESIKKFQVGFSDKASRFKLPLPYVGATYGLLNNIDEAIEPLHLFYEGEFEKLEKFLAKHQSEQKSD